jgi:hypothetical protein
VDPVNPDSDPQHCLELLAMHEGLELEAGGFFILILLPEADIGRGERRQLHPGGRVGKNPVFFSFFLGFFVFFVFFLYICPEKRVFRVFFSFKNTFRCIQTSNYYHSY